MNTLNDLQKLLDEYDLGVIDRDNNGQIIIYTGRKSLEDGRLVSIETHFEEEAREAPDYDEEEHSLIDKIEASGMSLRTIIGGFMDERRMGEQWLAWLRTLANEEKEQE